LLLLILFNKRKQAWFVRQYLRQNKNTYKKMAFLARVKPGILPQPGFLNLDAGVGIIRETRLLIL
jgi:hypothetical protein